MTRDGRVVGQHRRDRGIHDRPTQGPGRRDGRTLFRGRDPAAQRRVVIGRRAGLGRRALLAEQVNWLVDAPRQPFDCLAQIRYNSPRSPARVTPLPENRMRVEFHAPCEGVAPGQAVVCYQDDQVLGGGWIESTEPV